MKSSAMMLSADAYFFLLFSRGGPFESEKIIFFFFWKCLLWVYSLFRLSWLKYISRSKICIIDTSILLSYHLYDLQIFCIWSVTSAAAPRVLVWSSIVWIDLICTYVHCLSRQSNIILLQNLRLSRWNTIDWTRVYWTKKSMK